MIKLGSKVKDKVTGFMGIATARVNYLNGCIQYCIEPRVDKDGKKSKDHYIDEGQLAVLDEDLVQIESPASSPSGVMPNAPDRV